jgi:cell division septum initiation protein DivIVA
MSDEDLKFPAALRGYARAAVDEAVLDLNRDILRLSAQNAQLVEELKQAKLEIEELSSKLDESQSPTYAGLGNQAAIILASAEDQATRLMAHAEGEKIRILGSINEEVETKKAEADSYYESLVAEADRKGQRAINVARGEANELLAKTELEAKRLIEEASREASAIRGEIATEVAKLRADTKRQTELQKAEAEKDIAEKRLLLQKQSVREIDLEKAALIIGEQARIDLELELTGRRAEAEKEYLAKHQEAVHQTQKYLDDAKLQLQNAIARTNAAQLEAETIESAARSINKKTTDDARLQAETLIASAEAEARNLIAEAKAKVARELDESTAKLQQLEVERKTVGSYLEQLEKIVAASKNSLK